MFQKSAEKRRNESGRLIAAIKCIKKTGLARNRPPFSKRPENYIGHVKNYVLCRKNYIRHN